MVPTAGKKGVVVVAEVVNGVVKVSVAITKVDLLDVASVVCAAIVSAVLPKVLITGLVAVAAVFVGVVLSIVATVVILA